MNNKYYNEVINIKNILVENNDEDFGNIFMENIDRFKRAIRNRAHASYKDAIAMIAVIISGAFAEQFEGGYTFYIPATRDVLDEDTIKVAKKILKGGCKLENHITVYKWSYEE